MSDNPVIFCYTTEVSIGGPRYSDFLVSEKGRRLPYRKDEKAPRDASKELNRAWGFSDGNCNEYKDNKIVSKEREPDFDYKEFEQAASNLRRHCRIRVLICVRKNGEKELRLLPKDSDGS